MIGQNLGSFRIEGVLGSGAMGVVYRAVHEPSQKPAAVKVILGEAARGNLSDRFKRESEILQQFRHPNIVRCLAIGRSKGTSYFAMEFIDGVTLEQELERRGALPWPEVAGLGAQICEALQYAHDRQIVHRDLKPSNLMIMPEGQLKLTDFGIAKDLDATTDLTATGRTLGTAAYMAPEQIKGFGISHKTDLYALGAILYQMITGEPPFQGPTAIVLMHAHLNLDPPRPSAKVPEIPRALDDLVVQLMAKDPAARPQFADQVGLKLAELRDKAARSQKVAMVWTPEQIERNPPRAGSLPSPDSAVGGLDSAPRTRSRKARRGRTSADLAAEGGGGIAAWAGRHGETLLLLAALAAVGSAIGYFLYPPSARYLFAQAEKGMASDQYTDWLLARDKYLDPLDERFPDHPFREQTEGWRDRIALTQAERRSAVLERPNLAALSRPNGELEQLYFDTFEDASAAMKRHDEPAAAAAWRRMLEKLGPFGPEGRGWALLAGRKAEEMETVAERIRLRAADDLLEIQVADRLAQAEASARLRRDFLERYGEHPYLADLVERVRATAPPPEDLPPP